MSQEPTDKLSQPSPAHRIREARDRRGLTQAALANQLGVSRPMIAQWETGVRHPWISTLKRLAEALEVSYEWLAFGDEGVVPREETPSLDPTLLATVQAVVTDVFDEQDLDTDEPYFFQVVVIIYAVAHRLQMAKIIPTSASFKSQLRESVLHVLSA